MEQQALEQAAKILWSAWRAGTRLSALPESCRPASRPDGYRIQAAVARLSGQEIFGWKIAATSSAGQKHIGVDGPLAGRLLRNRVFDSGARVSLRNNIMKVAEAEFAFRMKRDLPPRSQPYSTAEVLAAVDTLHPAIEIPDSRFEDFVTVGAPQLIADHACASYFVLGPATVAEWRQIDIAGHRIAAQIDGKPASEGIGSNALGDPRVALTWIANELSFMGDRLRAGETVTTGTCIVPAAIAPGNHVVADFGVIGRVEATMVA